MAATIDTGQSLDELGYWGVWADAESLQSLLRKRGAMTAAQALNSDTLHALYVGSRPLPDKRV